MSERESELATALAALRDRLAAAAQTAGRDVADVELLPITKFFPASDVAILWRLGCRSFGESREQEASAKIAEFQALTGATDVRWHMVGQIQRNKAKHIAAWADTVHSLSAPKVAAALDRGALQAIDDGLRIDPVNVFVQISDAICAQVAQADGLRLVGLMAIPPLGVDPDEAFAALAAEHRRVRTVHPGATQLSAGMSGDLEAAVRHGSTCVRVGTALMGNRPLTSP